MENHDSLTHDQHVVNTLSVNPEIKPFYRAVGRKTSFTLVTKEYKSLLTLMINVD